MLKTAPVSHLSLLRRRAGLPLREAARRLDVLHTKLVYWEKTGKVPQPDLVGKIAALYGVGVEEVLGLKPASEPKATGGKLGQIFTSASKLPRRQQQKIIEFVEPFIRNYEREQVTAQS